MKQTIDESMFIQRFKDYGRLKTAETAGNFSVAGLRALFEYLQELESGMDEEMELDVIALCCDFNEVDVSEVEQETGIKLEDLGDHTTVIVVDNETVIYQAF